MSYVMYSRKRRPRGWLIAVAPFLAISPNTASAARGAPAPAPVPAPAQAPAPAPAPASARTTTSSGAGLGRVRRRPESPIAVAHRTAPLYARPCWGVCGWVSARPSPCLCSPGEHAVRARLAGGGKGRQAARPRARERACASACRTYVLVVLLDDVEVACVCAARAKQFGEGLREGGAGQRAPWHMSARCW